MIAILFIMTGYITISGYLNIKFIKTLNNHASVIVAQQVKIKKLEDKLYGFGE
jgi:hypothetical protein